MKALLTIAISLITSLNILQAADFEEVDLNTELHEQQQFLNYPTIKDEFDKIYAIKNQNFQFKYFVSYRNILPPGIPAGKYIANEHVALFKSTHDNTMCAVRANIVWRKDDGLNTLDEDYSEPARFYSCYKL